MMTIIFISIISMFDSSNFYTIKSKHAGRSLDVCQDSDKKGMLIIYDHYGGPNQLFNLKPNGVEV
jgi:hypothetical protein